MKINLIFAILVIPSASLHAQTFTVGDMAQLSPPTLQTGIVAHPSPQPQDPATAPAVVQFPQWRGQYEGAPDFSTQIIKTQQGWSRLWGRLGRPMPKALDESREMAVFIAIGKRPTGGFRPEVTSATERGGQFVVAFTDGKPSREMFVTQAFSQPWVVALVPLTSLPVAFQGQEK